MSDDERRLFVDPSVFITLAAVGEVSLLGGLDGAVSVPHRVAREIEDDPARARLERAKRAGWLEITEDPAEIRRAADHLGRTVPENAVESSRVEGDVVLLACGMAAGRPVVVTDDKPLRNACKALSIPVAGSIAVLVRAVERDDLEPQTAKNRLYAMDEVGARLSASLVKRAERLIDDAA